MTAAIAFLLVLAGSNLWGYFRSREYLTEAAFRNIRNVAALEASETFQFVSSAESLVTSIVAGNEHLFGLLRAWRPIDDDIDQDPIARALQSHLLAKAAENSSLKEFSVISRYGRLVASSNVTRVPGEDLRASSCFQVGKTGSGIVAFEYRESESLRGDESPSPERSSEPFLVVAGRIVDRTGLFLGVLCARSHFEIHNSMLIAHRERTERATIHLLDSKGTIVCGSSSDAHGTLYSDRSPRLKENLILDQRAWEGYYRDDSGTEIMVSYAPIAMLDWGVVVEVPVRQALADLERLKWQAVAASILLALGLTLAVSVAWRMLVHPLKALSRASDRMAAGVPGETVHPGGPRELLDLAAAFNRMSLALRDSQETLESRITERTTALRESQEFSELLLNSIDQRVLVVNNEFQVIKANTAAIRLHGPQLLGSKCCETLEGLNEVPEDYPVRHTFLTGERASAERFQRTLGGQELIRVETCPVFDHEGGVQSVVEIGRVITTEKRLQMQMIYQEKMAAFGQLAAGVAHEIGNPLAAIDSQLQLARRDPSRTQETLDIVQNQVGRLGRMLRELIGFASRRQDDISLVSVNQVIEDVMRLLQHDPRARTVRFIPQLARRLPGIRTKADQLMQVLLNLGINALDAMSDGGTLVFETAMGDTEVIVRISDTGPGISKDAQLHLFEPFFTTKAPGRGTGLGLFVSKGIVDGMGGELNLEDTGEAGSTFVVHLPIDSDREDGRAV
ncbi:MAG: ATP-binding protein [Myxococcota bacterium]